MLEPSKKKKGREQEESFRLHGMKCITTLNNALV